MPEHWSLRRWIRESQAFMAHKPRWQIAFRAVLKWPRFAVKQRRDEREIRIRQGIRE